jgi:hypothetical protein
MSPSRARQRAAGRRAAQACVMVAALGAAASAAAQNIPYQSPQRSAIGSGLGQELPPKGGYFEPRIEVATQYAQNINLAELSSERDNAFGIELSPGVYASYNSDFLAAAIDYSLIGRMWDSSAYNDVSHSLAANGRWTAVRDLLYVDAEAGYGDTIIDSRNGLNYGGRGVFGQGNLTEQATASVSPVLQKRFRLVEFKASYSYGRVWYLDKGKGVDTPTVGFIGTDNSKDQSAKVSLATVREDRRLNGRIYYEWDKSEYDRSLPYENERAGVGVSMGLTRTIAIVGDAGKESALDKSTTQGGLDSDYWNAGLKWAPDPRTSAEGRYGERFFGSSYMASISHRARFLEFTASYSEDPDVQTRQLSLGEFDPGQIPPGVDPGADFGRFNSQPYVSKDSRLTVTAKGSRTKVSLDVWDTRRNYMQNAYGDEQGMGGSLNASRQLAANVSVDADVSYFDHQRDASTGIPIPTLATHDYDTQFLLRGNYDFGPRLVTSAEAGYLNRSGTSNYDGWWIGLRARWLPEFR